MKTKQYFSTCTIQRIKLVKIGRFTGNGSMIIDRQEIRTEPHGTPLFTEAETSTGICKSCRDGWEVKGNKFASPEERERATRKD